MPIKATRGTVTGQPTPAHQQPDNRAIAKEQLEIVRSVAAQLPQSEREVFLLKLADPDMPQKEMAQTLGISENAAKVRWHRERNRMKALLEAEYPGEFSHSFR